MTVSDTNSDNSTEKVKITPPGVVEQPLHVALITSRKDGRVKSIATSRTKHKHKAELS